MGLSIDGRVVGRGGGALMLPGVYTGRALPVGGLGRPGQQGHLPADGHSAWVKQGEARRPAGAQGGWRGAGACDGPALPGTLEQAGGAYVCRTGSPMPAAWEATLLRLDTRGACR